MSGNKNVELARKEKKLPKYLEKILADEQREEMKLKVQEQLVDTIVPAVKKMLEEKLPDYEIHLTVFEFRASPTTVVFHIGLKDSISFPIDLTVTDQALKALATELA